MAGQVENRFIQPPTSRDQTPERADAVATHVLAKLPLVAGGLVAIVGGIHLFAWLEGAIVERGRGVITMKTNTALCLFLLGSALLMLNRRNFPGALRAWLTNLPAGFAALIGGITLVENLAGWDFGIDQILAMEPPGAAGMDFPNRMGTPASACAVLAGVATFLMGRGRSRSVKWAQGLSLTVLVLGLLSSVGYLYGVEWLYGVARISAIAWPTALCLVGLGAGLLLARPTEGILAQVVAADPGGIMVRRLLPSVLLLPIAFGWLQVSGARLGFFDSAMGTALLMVAFIVLLSALTWHAGHRGSRMAAELAKQQEFLAVTLQSIGDAVIACDAGGRVTFLNPVGAKLTGWRHDDALGQSIGQVFKIINERTGEPAEDVVRRVLHEGQIVALANHTALLTRQGQRVPIEDSAAPIRDSAGRLTGAVLVFHDVGEKRQAQEALKQSEERFSVIHEKAPFAITLTKLPEGTIESVNDAFLKLFQLERGEAIGKTSIELGIADEASRALVAAQFAERGMVRELELQRTTKNGEERFLLLSLDPVEIRGDRYALTTLQDITERKLQERRVQKLTRLYRVLSNVNVAIVRSRDALELYREVCRILAEDGERPLVWMGLVEGRTVRPVASYGEAVSYMEGLRVEVDGEFGRGPSGTSVRENRPVVNDDFSVNPATKPWREAALRHNLRASASFPLRKEGVVVGSLTLYAKEAGTFDVEQVALFEQLCANISYAVEKMRQEKSLRESELELREADQRKNDFLAVLSHELRNPLAPVKNSLYILERTAPGSERALHAKQVIDRQVGQLARLVDDLLDVTRITRGKIQIQRKPLELTGLVHRVAEDHRSVFAKAGVEIELYPLERPLWVNADSARIIQAVGNLLQNAAKFTPKGGRVTVALSESVSERMALVQVRDTGIGIAPDVMRRLFQPFTQAESSLDRSKGGLGLGLALVRGLAELHGGGVHVRSDGLGQGAEFTLRLPIHGQAAASEPARGQKSGLRSRRVLVIEDNRDAAESLREVLLFGNHEVEVAYNGTDGVAKARWFKPDLVLCDIGLPGMDGYDVARELRTDPRLEKTHLVAVSGYALPEDLQRAAEAGFNGHLAKPPSIDKIEELVCSVPPAIGSARSQAQSGWFGEGWKEPAE